MVINVIPQKRCLISKRCFYTTVLFLIFPLYSVPLIIYGMWKYEKWAFVLWAFFMGLVGILVPPTGDFYRYTMDYELYKGLEWGDFLLLAGLKNELMLPLISYGIGELGLHFDLSRFLYNFLGYYLLGLLYLDIVKHNPNLQRGKIALYALGFFVSFNLTTFCYRYFLSAILFVYGAYYVVYKERKAGWGLVALAIFNHFSYIIQALALLFQQMHFFRFGRKTVIFLIVVSLFVDTSFIVSLFSALPFDFVSHYMAYLDGHWAGDFWEERSLQYKINMFVGNAIQYVCMLVYIILYYRSAPKYNSLVNSMLFLTFLSTPFVTINGRFIIVMTYFVKIHLLKIFDGSRQMLKYLKIMFWLMMLSNLMGLWGQRRQLAISDVTMMLCSGGGARCDYGALNYFTEFWASDNTDPIERLYIQWGFSKFFPMKAICAHITSWNRKASVKFRVDVAMMCKMGFDIGLKEMSEDELTFCKQAVATYKDLKPVILNGDFYRLVSPYEGNHTAVMTVDAQKSQSVLYTYNIHPRFSEDLYPIRLQGLDPNKQYRIEEINLMPGKSSGFAENGQVYSGDYLMKVGLRLFTTEDLSSHIFKLTAM